MADIEPILLVAGEVREVAAKRDYTDRVTGEVRVGTGRKAQVLTYGGFVTISIGQDFDGVPVQEGQVIFWKVRLMDWRMAREGKADLTGTAKLYAGPVSAEELDALGKAGAILSAVKG